MSKTVLFYNLASPASNEKGLPFIRAARALGCRVISVVHEAGSELLCGDVNEVLPLGEISKLRDLISRYEVDLVLTVNSRLTRFLAGEVSASGRSCIPTFSEKAARTLSLKEICAQHLKSLGLNAVEHWLPTSLDDWSAIPDDLPILLKPTFSTGAVDTIPFENKQHLLECFESGVECETLGKKVALAEFHDINSSGRIFGRWMVQRRIDFKQQIGLEIAVVGGEVTIVHAGEILTESENRVSAYAHVGPIQLAPEIEIGITKVIQSLEIQNANLTPDILIDQNDDWFLIDANLNVGSEGLLEVLQARGLDYPLESLKGFLGLPHSFATNSQFVASVAPAGFKAGVAQIIKCSTFEDLRNGVVLSLQP